MHASWVKGGLVAVGVLAISLTGAVAMADPITYFDLSGSGSITPFGSGYRVQFTDYNLSLFLDPGHTVGAGGGSYGSYVVHFNQGGGFLSGPFSVNGALTGYTGSTPGNGTPGNGWIENGSQNGNHSVVPEPASMLLLGSGLAGLGLLRRRTQN